MSKKSVACLTMTEAFNRLVIRIDQGQSEKAHGKVLGLPTLEEADVSVRQNKHFRPTHESCEGADIDPQRVPPKCHCLHEGGASANKRVDYPVNCPGYTGDSFM